MEDTFMGLLAFGGIAITCALITQVFSGDDEKQVSGLAGLSFIAFLGFMLYQVCR